MNVHLTCTSYIPTDKNRWPNLRKNCTRLSFGEYGVLVEKRNESCDVDIKILVVFVEDLIDENACETIFSGIRAEIINASSSSATNYCLAVCGHEKTSPIANAKSPSISSRKKTTALKLAYQIADETDNCFVINLDEVFSFLGYSRILDNRNWYFAHLRLSNFGIQVLDEQLALFIERFQQAPLKALILDCDNTLWGGVVGEIGVGGLQLGTDGTGQVFVDFQKTIKALSQNGIILGLCSRNIEEDVKAVFDTHDAMSLQWSDIVISKVNWQEKSINLMEISDELNIAPSSIMFWDDNPIEREKVKINCPDIKVAEVPAEVFEWPTILASYHGLASFNITEEDRRKTAQYKGRQKFLSEKEQTKLDHRSFLATIELKPEVKAINDSLISRAAQMTQKTTQFNLRNVKYTEQELRALALNSKNILLICSAKDKFGDHGNVGLGIIKKRGNEGAFLDSFLFSCRVLGRELEFWFLQQILHQLNEVGVKTLQMEYCQSKRNQIAKQFFASVEERANVDDRVDESSQASESLQKVIVLDTAVELVNLEELYKC